MAGRNDSFVLHDLKVETRRGGRPFVCSHREGDFFLVIGENLVFPGGAAFSLYSLAALLPLLPAKQRPTHANDWMTSDADVACPDPNCGAVFHITRLGRRTFRHSETTLVPLPGGPAAGRRAGKPSKKLAKKPARKRTAGGSA